MKVVYPIHVQQNTHNQLPTPIAQNIPQDTNPSVGIIASYTWENYVWKPYRN